MTEHERPDRTDVDFVVGPSGDADGDEVLDTGLPHRSDRRLLVGLVIGALVAVGAVVAVRSNGTSHPTAAPSGSSSSGSFVPVVPTFPTLTVGPEPTPAPVDLGARLCQANRNCTHPATPARVRAGIVSAIRKYLGSVRRLRIRDSRLTAGSHAARALFARKITADTPSGNLVVIAADIDPNSDLSVPISGGTQLSIGVQSVIDGYVVGGSITLSGPRNGLRALPKINGLLNDQRLVANR